MRDIRDFYIAQSGVDRKALLSHPYDAAREAYLQRFAEQEGRGYLRNFYKAYRGLTPQQALDRLASRTGPSASHLADVFFAVHPDEDILGAYQRQALAALSGIQLRQIIAQR
jgi:hypothetical protein